MADPTTHLEIDMSRFLHYIEDPARTYRSADRSRLPLQYSSSDVSTWPIVPPEGYRYLLALFGYRQLRARIVDIVEDEGPERENAEHTPNDPCWIIFGPEPKEDGIPRESKQRASFEAGPANPYSEHTDSDAVIVYPTPRVQSIPQPLPFELWDPHNHGLHNQGWTVLDFLKGDPNPPRVEGAHTSIQDAINKSISNPRKYPGGIPGAEPGIWPAIDELFRAAKIFFAASEGYKSLHGKCDSEEGWTKISGEKEFITIRGLSSKYTPSEVRNAAATAWKCVFELLYQVLDDLALAMKINYRALQRFCESSRTLGQTNGASMIRIFRYEYNTPFQVLAEAHRDLGMLSLVVGDKPGLEVWNKKLEINDYDPIETRYQPGMCTLMAGRQLEHFSNKVYEAARHRVMSYGPQQPEIGACDTPRSNMKKAFDKLRKMPEKLPKYRYSIVFVLRADRDVTIDYKDLSSKVCGDVTWRGGKGAPQTAGELFDRIRKAHFNVNTHVDEREKQKQELTEKKHAEKLEEGVNKCDVAYGDEIHRKAKKQHPLVRPSEEFAPPPHPPPSHRRTQLGIVKHAQADAMPQSQYDTSTPSMLTPTSHSICSTPSTETSTGNSPQAQDSG